MAIHHLVSRGVEMAQSRVDKVQWDNVQQLSGSAYTILLLTFLVHFVLYLSVHYTYGLLVPHLAMIEAPSRTTVIKTTTRTNYRDEETEESENPDAPLLTKEEKEFMQPQDEEILVFKEIPVTSSIRATIKHLRVVTGSKVATLRGAGGYMIFSSLSSVAYTVGRMMFPFWAVLLQAPLFALLCLFQAAWVQQMVAMPGKNYFQRVGELRRNGGFGKLFFPVMVVEVVELSVLSLPRNIMILSSAFLQDDTGRNVRVVSTVGMAVAALVFVLGFVFTVIPMKVALVRLQAALLPEETATVIPIDRSLGGAAVMNLAAAWKSFPREGVWRLIKTWIKSGIIQVTVMLFSFTLIAINVRLLAQPQFDRMVEQTREMYRA